MADSNPATPQNAAHSPAPPVTTGRGAWIVTGYGIFGLCVLGLIAYSVAQYVAH